MTETAAPIAQSMRTSTAARIGWAILIVATLYVCYFSHLGAIGFVGPDEPRYAWIARDMAETRDWVTPRLYGKPWFEKPVLYYWGAALCFKLFGVSEAAARLPSAISALLATLALAWLALRLYAAETARWLLLLLPTTVGMIGFSHAASTDMPFSGMLTIAMVCAAVVLGLTQNENTPILPRTPWLALILFGFFLGLAVLAKGPAAIILSGGAIFFWALFTKRWRDAFRLFHPAALASFCLTALPWYILCARRNPDFFRIFIIEHNFKRYLTPEFQHIQPFWYYGPILLLGLMPWTVLLLGDMRQEFGLLRTALKSGSPATFFVCWIVFPILFFTISKSKLPGYILSAIPPFVALLCRRIPQRMRYGNWLTRWGNLALLGLVLVILGLGPLHGVYSLPDATDTPYMWLGAALVILILGGVGITVLGLLRRPRAGLLLSVLAIVSAILGLSREHAWVLDGAVSTRLDAQLISKKYSDFSPDNVALYKVHRTVEYQMNFYLHRELPQWLPKSMRPNWVFTSHREERELELAGYKCDALWYASHSACHRLALGSADSVRGSGQSH